MESDTLPASERNGAAGTVAAVPLPPRAIQIWQERPDLQAAFDPVTPTGAQELTWWYYLHGFRELGLQLTEADDHAWLNQPHPELHQRSFTAITRLMHEMQARRWQAFGRQPAGRLTRIWRRLRHGWRRRFDPLNLVEEQEALLAWYFTSGLADANLSDLLSPEQARALLEPGCAGAAIPRIVNLIWRVDAAAQARFADPHDPAILDWCRTEGYRRWPILAHPLIGLAVPRARSGGDRMALPFGVNLFGHVRARLGVGEDVRMAALSLADAGIPYVIQDVAAGSIAPEENGFEDRISASMPYAINLFCMTGMETVATVLKHGRGRFLDHLNIGFWPWELPEWPDFWQHAYGFVDEVWASTRFAEQAFRANAPIPVSQMPMAVTVDATEGLRREDFGLPEGRFLFAFAFDGLSSFRRKNPWGCIEAFQQAFPDPTLPVGLVLKGLRVEDHPEWHKLQTAARADPRIHLLTGSYPRGALLDLFRSTDCFVSLHRSEGFGRNIAEAMLLGKPVIATAFSGNTDFTTPATSLPVPYREVTLANGDYPFGTGQVWAEPDLAAAALLMRQVFADEALRVRISAAGQSFVASAYAPGVVGEKYRSILAARYKNGVT